MDFWTINEVAERWGLSARRLQTMCQEGMIEGAVNFGREWAIPRNAEEPIDKRIKSGKYIRT